MGLQSLLLVLTRPIVSCVVLSSPIAGGPTGLLPRKSMAKVHDLLLFPQNLGRQRLRSLLVPCPALQPFAAQPYRKEHAFFILYSKQSLNPGL